MRDSGLIEHFTKENLTNYFGYLETAPTILRRRRTPSTVELMTRSFSVTLQCIMCDRPLAPGEKTAQRRRKNKALVSFVMSLGKSVQNKLAIVGPGDALNAAKVAAMKPPLTLKQIVASVPAWKKKMSNLQAKIDKCGPRTPGRPGVFFGLGFGWLWL